MVHDSTVKTAKIGPLKNFLLYEERKVRRGDTREASIFSAHFASSSGEKSICGLVGVSGIACSRPLGSISTTSRPSERMSPMEILSSWSGSTWNMRSTRPEVATEIIRWGNGSQD